VKAVVLYEHGGPEKLVLEANFRDPEAGADEVVVRVRATSLNYHDIFTRRGMPGIKLSFPVIAGLDVAGEIASIGSAVDAWAVGDRVLVDPINRVEGGLVGETIHGGLAELCRVKAHQLVRIPEGVSYEEAAALPCAYGTALRMMQTIGAVSAGERVLILGASGGVGVCCVQLAKLAGAEVVACAGSPDKLARLKELGADHTINYRETDFMKEIWSLYGKPARRAGNAKLGVDVAVNYTGGDTWVKTLRCLRVGGRLLTCGATAGFDPQEDLRFIWTFELKILGANSWARTDIEKLLSLVQSGELKVFVDRTYSLEQTNEAMQLIEDRNVFGKVVIIP
jgi:alcohol dehydrogenase